MSEDLSTYILHSQTNHEKDVSFLKNQIEMISQLNSVLKEEINQNKSLAKSLEHDLIIKSEKIDKLLNDIVLKNHENQVLLKEKEELNSKNFELIDKLKSYENENNAKNFSANMKSDEIEQLRNKNQSLMNEIKKITEKNDNLKFKLEEMQRSTEDSKIEYQKILYFNSQINSENYNLREEVIRRDNLIQKIKNENEYKVYQSNNTHELLKQEISRITHISTIEVNQLNSKLNDMNIKLKEIMRLKQEYEEKSISLEVQNNRITIQNNELRNEILFLKKQVSENNCLINSNDNLLRDKLKIIENLEHQVNQFMYLEKKIEGKTVEDYYQHNKLIVNMFNQLKKEHEECSLKIMFLSELQQEKQKPKNKEIKMDDCEYPNIQKNRFYEEKLKVIQDKFQKQYNEKMNIIDNLTKIVNEKQEIINKFQYDHHQINDNLRLINDQNAEKTRQFEEKIQELTKENNKITEEYIIIKNSYRKLESLYIELNQKYEFQHLQIKNIETTKQKDPDQGFEILNEKTKLIEVLQSQIKSLENKNTLFQKQINILSNEITEKEKLIERKSLKDLDESDCLYSNINLLKTELDEIKSKLICYESKKESGNLPENSNVQSLTEEEMKIKLIQNDFQLENLSTINFFQKEQIMLQEKQIQDLKTRSNIIEITENSSNSFNFNEDIFRNVEIEDSKSFFERFQYYLNKVNEQKIKIINLSKENQVLKNLNSTLIDSKGSEVEKYLLSNIKELENKIEFYNSNFERLKNEKNEKIDTVLSLSREIDFLKSERILHEEKISQLKSEIMRLNDFSQDSKSLIESFKNEIDNFKKLESQITVEKKNLEQKILILSENLEAANSKIQSLNSILSSKDEIIQSERSKNEINLKNLKINYEELLKKERDSIEELIKTERKKCDELIIKEKGIIEEKILLKEKEIKEKCEKSSKEIIESKSKSINILLSSLKKSKNIIESLYKVEAFLNEKLSLLDESKLSNSIISELKTKINKLEETNVNLSKQIKDLELTLEEKIKTCKFHLDFIKTKEEKMNNEFKLLLNSNKPNEEVQENQDEKKKMMNILIKSMRNSNLILDSLQLKESQLNEEIRILKQELNNQNKSINQCDNCKSLKRDNDQFISITNNQKRHIEKLEKTLTSIQPNKFEIENNILINEYKTMMRCLGSTDFMKKSNENEANNEKAKLFSSLVLNLKKSTKLITVLMEETRILQSKIDLITNDKS